MLKIAAMTTFFFTYNLFACSITFSEHTILLNEKNDQISFTHSDCTKNVNQQVMALLQNTTGLINAKNIQNSLIGDIQVSPKKFHIHQFKNLVKDNLFKESLEYEIEITNGSNIIPSSINLEQINDFKVLCQDCLRPGVHKISLTYPVRNTTQTKWLDIKVKKRVRGVIAVQPLSPFMSNNIVEKTKVEFFFSDNTDGLLTDRSRLDYYNVNKNIAPGMPIRLHDLKKKTLIRAGQIVNVLLNNKNINMTIKARAKSSGGINDNLELINTKSNKTINGIIKDNNLVEVIL